MPASVPAERTERAAYQDRYHPFFEEALKEESREEQLRAARLNWWHHGLDKCKQNPFVPIGMFATCYAMYGAVRSMRAGNSTQMQKFFRLRVGAQAFALVAMVGGGMYFDGVNPLKSLGTIPETVKRVQAKEAAAKEAALLAAATPAPKKELPKLTPTKFIPPPITPSSDSSPAIVDLPVVGKDRTLMTERERKQRMVDEFESKRKDAQRENDRQREKLGGKARSSAEDE